MRYIVIAHFAGAVNKSLLSSLSDAEQCCSQHILYTMRRSSDKWVNECRLLLHIIKFFRSTQYINYFRKNVVHSHSSQHIFGPIAHCVSFSCLLVCHCFLFFFLHIRTHTHKIQLKSTKIYMQQRQSTPSSISILRMLFQDEYFVRLLSNAGHRGTDSENLKERNETIPL